MEPGRCDNCDNASKYTCPACYKTSCSLNCVREHKKTYKCNGKVDPTRFIAKPDLLTAHSLDRDYNFLQQIGRQIVVDKSDAKSHRVYKPRDSWRAGARVHSMAKGMSRSVNNKSHWDNQRKQFVWTVELLDLLSESGKSNRKTIQVPDQTLISQIPVEADILTGEKEWVLKLRDFYCNELVLDNDATLQQAIKGKNVLEFPTLILAKKDEGSSSETDSTSSDSSDSSSSEDDSSDDSSDSDNEGPAEESTKEASTKSTINDSVDNDSVTNDSVTNDSVTNDSHNSKLIPEEADQLALKAEESAQSNNEEGPVLEAVNPPPTGSMPLNDTIDD